MMENEVKKEVPSYSIEVHEDKLTGKITKVLIFQENPSDTWYRGKWNRKKDGLLPPEIIADMQKFAIGLSNVNDKGQYIGKYELIMTNLPANPKSSKSSKSEYTAFIKEHLKKKGTDKEIAIKFNNKKVLVYIAVYLRKSRCDKGNDVDNFAKNILDSIKEYLGDDSQVDALIVEKKPLVGYPEEDLDFIEQAVVAITNPEAKSDIFKNMQNK